MVNIIFNISLALPVEKNVKPDFKPDISYQLYHDVTNINKPKLSITCTINTDILNIINIKKPTKSKQFKQKNQNLSKSYFYLELPDQWSNVHNLHKYITHLEIVDNFSNSSSQNNKNDKNIQNNIINLQDPSLKKIMISPGGKIIKFTYDIYPKNKIPLLEPIITDQIFHFIGHTALIYPQIDINKNINISLESRSSLKDNSILFANSFGIGSVQHITLPFKKFRHAAFAGGLYQTDTIQENNALLFSHGLTTETKSYVIDLFNKFMPVQLAFWKDHPVLNKNNMIFIHANNLINTTFTGTRTHDALSLLINESSPFLKEDLPEFLAHESWHTWMGDKFFSAHSYKHMAWLFEGSTDYYAYKTSYQADIFTASEWIKKYNRVLAKHYLSPVKNKSNQKIIDYFDEDPNYAQLPYDRGNIIAFELDNKIQALSLGKHSLDDVLKTLCSKNQKSGMILKDFEQALQKFYPDAKNFVRLYITEGKDLPLSSKLYISQTATLQFVNIKPENYGLDLQSAFVDKIVSGLSTKSVAYQQGLRNGQTVISHQVDYKDINKPILLKIISKNNTEQTFLLERIGKASLIPQYTE